MAKQDYEVVQNFTKNRILCMNMSVFLELTAMLQHICRLHFHATRFIMKNSSEFWMRWTSNAAHQIRIDCSGHFYDCKKPYHPLIQIVSMPYSNWYNRSRRTPANFIPFLQKLTFRTCVSNPTLYRMQNPLLPVWILAIQHSRL